MNRESIIGKVLLKGKLVLCSPLLIGSGVQREGSDVDTQILRDKNGRPFIPGTSVAGVLRAAFSQEKAFPEMKALFFGGKVEKLDAEVQSAVDIDDIELEKTEIVQRDGVCIDDVRGVAEDKKKYDYELVERGAEGDFRAEITLRGYHKEVLDDGLPTAVRRLAKGVAAGFRLGALTAKGFGRVQVDGLVMDRYDFGNPADAFAWLSEPRGKAADHDDEVKAEASDRPLTESNLIIDADFALVGSLLVKDADVPEDKKTDDKTAVHAVMKKSRNAYLIPGPSVKGALRHHAGRVLKNLGFQEPKKFLNGLMGLDDAALKAASKRKDEETLRQSRFFVDEVYIAQEAVKPFAQTRNRIDRFTGGTIGGALFTTEAVWGKGGKPVHIHFEIRDAEAADVGLALLLLKDLSLGRVPLGGEKSIGRGVLEGVHAKIWYKPKREENQNSEINVVIENGKPVEGDAKALQDCVDALAEKAKETEATA